MNRSGYRGRFAPSPTGPLHLGSLVAALASWLDARAAGGIWLVRIEDLDPPRCMPGAAEEILRVLAACGMHSDEAVWTQSHRGPHYQAALDHLVAAGLAYPCGCTRKDVADAVGSLPRHHDLVYPGTCRDGLRGKPARAWRARLPAPPRERIAFLDRWAGPQTQDLASAVGDFVLKRADGLWAYQLAVVVDDGAQGITDVVRGDDLLDSTPRQIWLQRALGLPTPRYLHLPVVRDATGEKLSKQTLAPAVDAAAPLSALRQAAAHLDLRIEDTVPTVARWLELAVAAWRRRLERLA